MPLGQPIAQPSTGHRFATVLIVVVLAGLSASCNVLGIRQTVDDVTAADMLAQAIGLASSGQIDRLCTLSPAEASTCEDSVRDLADLIPETGPTIRCSVPAPDIGPLRNGHVLVVEGIDGSGAPYLTEFIVYDNGIEIGVLDAVYWSGLSVQTYSEDTVAWRSDSSSMTCDRGGLPVDAVVLEQ